MTRAKKRENPGRLKPFHPLKVSLCGPGASRSKAQLRIRKTGGGRAERPSFPGTLWAPSDQLPPAGDFASSCFAIVILWTSSGPSASRNERA